MLEIEFKGMENVRANLRALIDKFPEEAGMALRSEGEEGMTECMRVCPYDQDNPHEDGTPHLNETGQVEGPDFENGDIIIRLSFGGGIDSIYPILQHEVQEYHHDQPETWKYLERPINERAKFMATNLIKKINLERVMHG